MFKLLALAALVAAVSAGTNEAGKKFLEENAKKDGVITLPSGLQYKVLRTGDGAAHPKAGTSCECHYEGRTAQEYPNGDTFDSSYARGSPTSFAPNQVIKGWTEAMQLMVEGDKWEMYIPSELGYGDSGSPPKIGGGDVLVFTMEILKINGETVPAARCDPTTNEGCDEKEVKFIAKVSEKFGGVKAKLQTELDRVKKAQGGKMKPSLAAWFAKRVNILTKLIAASSDEL